MSNLLTIIAIPVVIIMFLLICVALALLNKLSGSISMLLSLQGQDSAKNDLSIQSLFSQLDLQHSSISDIETNLMKAIESTKQEIIAKDERNGAYYTDIIHTVQATNQYMHQLLPLAELKPQIEAILETQAKAVAAKGYSLRNMFDKLISLREAAHIYMADLSDIMAKLDSPIASNERIELLKRYANLTRLFMKKADPENRYPHYIIYERPLSSVMRAKADLLREPDDLRESPAEFGVNIHKAKQDPDPRTAAVEPKYSRHSKKSVDTPTPQPSESSRGVTD